MFIDTTTIHLKAGEGGNGCNSFYKTTMYKRGRPDGGEGGNGGSIVVLSDRNIQTLLDFRYNKHFTARSGRHGSSNHKKGRSGEDLIVRVPPGTIIYHSETKEALRDLTADGQKVIVARGGRGGRGNSRFREAGEGEPGEELDVRLELKLIAEVGIIGYPNAGKSTFISAVSNTRPKIANYPFTTKEPMLGVVKTEDKDFVVADIPGLIKGAHEGRGLGHQFLRHVERTKVLLHLVDMAAVDCRDPVSDFKTINEELGLYSRKLSKKRQIVVGNKMDLEAAAGNFERFKKETGVDAFSVSALKKEGLEDVITAILETL